MCWPNIRISLILSKINTQLIFVSHLFSQTLWFWLNTRPLDELTDGSSDFFQTSSTVHTFADQLKIFHRKQHSFPTSCIAWHVVGAEQLPIPEQTFGSDWLFPKIWYWHWFPTFWIAFTCIWSSTSSISLTNICIWSSESFPKHTGNSHSAPLQPEIQVHVSSGKQSPWEEQQWSQWRCTRQQKH